MLPEFEHPDASLLQDPLALRAAPRVAVDLAARVVVGGLPGPLPARVRDLSTCGMCLASATPFPAKSLRRVELMLRDGAISARAEGVWQRDLPGTDAVLTGIALVDPAPEVSARLWDEVTRIGRDLARFLHEQTTLYELGAEEALGLAQVTRRRTIPAGQWLYREGDAPTPGDALLLLTEGEVALLVRVRDAIDTEIARVGPGALLGGTPMLAGVPQSESAVACGEVRALEIDREAMRHLRMAKPWLGYRLSQAALRAAAARFALLTARLRDRL